MVATWIAITLCLRALSGVLADEDTSGPVEEYRDVPLGVDPQLCSSRIIHDVLVPGGRGYFFSWEEPGTRMLKLDWSEAREFCHARCMDLVSLERNIENNFIKERLVKGKQRYTWTGGRNCNFPGCEREDLMPARVFGWFWVGSLQKMPPTTNRIDTDWSDVGGLGVPQPDNREHLQGGPEEECLAILNNFYGDGPHWHDIACNHRMPFVCEDRYALLSAVLQKETSQTVTSEQPLPSYE